MNRILAVIMVLIAASAGVSAYNGGKQATFTPNIGMKELENKVYYSHLLSEYETKKAYSEGLTKCADKNKYYLPSHASADADGCYDVLGYLESLALVGQESSKAGIMHSSSASVSEEGIFKFDAACDAAHAGSRAMRYDDIKYLLEGGTLGTSASGIYILEGFNDVSGSSAIVSGEFLVDLLNSGNLNCNEYATTGITTEKALKLKTFTTTDRALSHGSCSGANVMCVYD